MAASDYSDTIAVFIPGIIYVDKDAVGDNDGTSWTDAFTDLNDALVTGGSTNYIWVADGTYTPAATNRNATFSIKNGMTLLGGFNGTESAASQRDAQTNVTILSGDLLSNDNATITDVETTRQDNSIHVVTLRGDIDNVLVDGFTISGGNANDASQSTYGIRGGAIIAHPLALNNKVISTFRNCILEENSGSNTAVYTSYTSVGVRDLVIDTNFENCIFRNNYSKDFTAVLFGGASGFGIYSKGSLVNCLFYGNVSNAASSAVYLGTSTTSGGNATGIDVDIINCTFANNTAPSGHVITMVGAANSRIKNSIIYSNGSLTPFAITSSASVVSNSIVEGGQLSATDIDPIFIDGTSNDFTLNCTSPAIGAGDATGLTLPALDLAGNARVTNTVDLGAYEYNGSIYASVTAVAKDFTAELDENGNFTINPSDIDGGSGTVCGLDYILSVDNDTFTCADLGSQTITLTITETVSNASATATANVTVVDAMIPTIVAQDITVVVNASGNATIAVADIENGSTDNCTLDANLVFSLDKTTFSCQDIGEQYVTLSVIDAAGNEATQIVTVTVEDDIDPAISVQDITLQLGSDGTVTLLASDLDNGSSDNCDFTFAVSQSVFDCDNLGDNTVTVTVEDGDGNTATEDVTVTVEATIADQIVSTPTTTSFCPSGSTLVSIDLGGSETGINYSLRNSANNAVVAGPIVGTGAALSFSDVSLLETTTFNVLAEYEPEPNYALAFDGVDDYIEAPLESTFDYRGSNTIEGWVKNTSLPNTTSQEPIFFIGNNVVSDIEVYIQAGSLSLTVAFSRGYPEFGYVQFPTPPRDEWYHLAITVDGLTVKAYYNGVEQTSIISVVSNLAMKKTNNAYLNLGTITSAGFDTNEKHMQGSLDEVRLWDVPRTRTEILSTMNQTLVGDETHLVAYYNMDEGTGALMTDLVAGNDGDLNNMDPATDWIIGAILSNGKCGTQMTTEVTIGDNVPPTAISQDLTIQLDDSGQATILANSINNSSTDNCSDAASLISTLDISTFDCSMLGENIVQLSITDPGGNTGTTTAKVTVEDVSLPSAITFPTLTKPLDASGSVTITAVEFNNGSTDNCTDAVDLVFGLDQTVFDCSHVGSNTLTFSATDISGNVRQVPVNLIITDAAPSVTTRNITVELDANGTVQINPSEVILTTSDDCTDVSNISSSLDIFTFSCSDIRISTDAATGIPVGSPIPVEVIVTVTDANNNSSTASASVIVTENIVPVVVTKSATVTLDGSGNGILTVADINDGSSDNCTAPAALTFSLDITTFDTDDMGENTVMLSVTDLSGNVATGAATVYVSDKPAQVATFTGNTDRTFGDADFTISATVDSNLPVTFTVISGGVTMAGGIGNNASGGSATFEITAAGPVVINATNNGNVNFAPLNETINLDIAKVTQILTVESIANQAQIAGPITVVADVDSNLPLDYFVNGPRHDRRKYHYSHWKCRYCSINSESGWYC